MGTTNHYRTGSLKPHLVRVMKCVMLPFLIPLDKRQGTHLLHKACLLYTNNASYLGIRKLQQMITTGIPRSWGRIGHSTADADGRRIVGRVQKIRCAGDVS
ncbi:hypothetical protein TNCV_2355381 [Trichonephila clavipes]|nr:hypothetical protein TNCV_2355381 [Trichonephila clavipes]